MVGGAGIGRGSNHRCFRPLLRRPKRRRPPLEDNKVLEHRRRPEARRQRRKEVTEMLSLIETLTGFAAIMLMLSLLVKTLTSVIKNQWDYYSDNLKHEVQRLALETTGKTWPPLIRKPAAPDWAKNIHWERLGDELLPPAYMSWFLKQLDQNAKEFD